VKLSDFKPTQNVQKGHESDLDSVLVAGDLGKDNFFEPLLNPASQNNTYNPSVHVGNKGLNLGNLESQEIKEHVYDSDRKIYENCSKMICSDYKPTQNVQAGKAEKWDPVKATGILGGGETFLAKTFDNEAKISDFEKGHYSNKGPIRGSLTAPELDAEIDRNLKTVTRNTKNSHILGDSFKPTLDTFTRGPLMERYPLVPDTRPMTQNPVG